MSWSKKRKGTAMIHKHSDCEYGIVDNHYGIYFRGIKFRDLKEAQVFVEANFVPHYAISAVYTEGNVTAYGFAEWQAKFNYDRLMRGSKKPLYKIVSRRKIIQNS